MLQCGIIGSTLRSRSSYFLQFKLRKINLFGCFKGLITYLIRSQVGLEIIKYFILKWIINVIYFQAGARRWLVLRRSAPVWSQLLAPKVISEERARQLQLEIDIWQQKTKLWVDREETTKLHVEVITAFIINLNQSLLKQCYEILIK